MDFAVLSLVTAMDEEGDDLYPSMILPVDAAVPPSDMIAMLGDALMKFHQYEDDELPTFSEYRVELTYMPTGTDDEPYDPEEMGLKVAA